MSHMTFLPSVSNSRKRIREQAQFSDEEIEKPTKKFAGVDKFGPDFSGSDNDFDLDHHSDSDVEGHLNRNVVGVSQSDRLQDLEPLEQHNEQDRYLLHSLGPEPSSNKITDIMRNTRQGKMTKERREKTQKQDRRPKALSRRSVVALPVVGSSNQSNASSARPSVPTSPQNDNEVADTLDDRILGLFGGEDEDTNEQTENTNQAAASSSSEPQNDRMPAPQLRMVDGRIVIDTESLFIQQPVQTEHVVRTEVSGQKTRVTSATYAKRISSERWSQEDIDRFYWALQMCGTDFSMIEILFPTRTRSHIRNRFKKEERENPQKVDEALKNKIPLDVEEFKACIARKKEMMANVENREADGQQ